MERSDISNRWGLKIMQERAVALGMNFSFESGQNQGTKVIVEIKKSKKENL